MSTWFVCRHPGAIEWMRKQPRRIDHWVLHLDPDKVEAGDTVIGILPMAAAAEVCAKGAEYLALNFNMPRSKRGTEISAQEMAAFGCTLTRFTVIKESE